jgi:hypothetical protein
MVEQLMLAMNWSLADEEVCILRLHNRLFQCSSGLNVNPHYSTFSAQIETPLILCLQRDFTAKALFWGGGAGVGGTGS